MKIYKLYIKQLESILKEKSDHWFIQKQVLLRELLGLDIDISEFKLDQIIDILDVQRDGLICVTDLTDYL